MTITSQTGIFGFGIQEDGLKGGAVPAWYRHKALSVGLGAVVEKQVAPPEIGGTNNPTGAYKSGHYFAGRVSLQPRLNGVLGWLLLAATGNSASGVSAEDANLFDHVFSQAPGNASFIPFMSVRKVIPGTDKFGDTGSDCIVSGMTWNFPQVGPATMDMDIVGRLCTLDNDPDVNFTWANTYENYDSVPMSMTGTGIVLAGFSNDPLPATGARVTLANNTTTVQEERVIGSYFPDDYATRQRALQVEFTYKWADGALWRYIYNGGDPADLGFLPCLDFTSFNLRVESPCEIEGTNTIAYPWSITFAAPKIDWQVSPIQLEGDEIISLQLTGTALEADTTDPEDYFTITLQNETASYPMPTA